MLGCMTKLDEAVMADFERHRRRADPGESGRFRRRAALATEHGRIAWRDGTLVVESFQTRLTAQG